MCKCAAGTVVCCCCSCALSLFMSILTILIVIAILAVVAIYFGFYNIDDTAPPLAKLINDTRDQINAKVSDEVKKIN